MNERILGEGESGKFAATIAAGGLIEFRADFYCARCFLEKSCGTEKSFVG